VTGHPRVHDIRTIRTIRVIRDLLVLILSRISQMNRMTRIWSQLLMYFTIVFGADTVISSTWNSFKKIPTAAGAFSPTTAHSTAPLRND
jgi:hypothetical protein